MKMWTDSGENWSVEELDAMRRGVCFGKGSSQPAATSSTVNQSNLPEYARPYFEGIMNRAEGLSNEGYIPYGGQRVAPQNATQQDVLANVRQLPQDYSFQYTNAVNAMKPAGTAATSLMGYQANPITSAYNAQTYGADAGEFDQAAADKYMSPYITNVLDYQRGMANRDFNEQQAGRNAQAIKSGAFGGSRQAVADMVAQRTLNQQLQGIDATGMQQAYTNAQQMFGADRQARIQNEQFGAQFGEASLARDDANSMQAQIASEQARQAGAAIQGQGGNLALQQGMGLGSLAKDRLNANLQSYGMLNQLGGQQQATEQQMLDAGYQDFINQRDYDRQSVNWLSGILRGVPVQAQSETIQYQSQNPTSQALGAGLGALGLYKAFQ
jgi:hypothetical protein